MASPRTNGNRSWHFLALLLLLEMTLYGTLMAMELPMELMREGANLHKSIEYARHTQFPVAADVLLQSASPNVGENMENTMSSDSDDDNVDEAVAVPEVHGHEDNFSQEDRQHQLEAQQPHHKHQHNNNDRAFVKLPALHKHNHIYTHLRTQPAPRHCSIRICSKIAGHCQAMGPIAPFGSACVAGEQIEVYNMDCM